MKIYRTDVSYVTGIIVGVIFTVLINSSVHPFVFLLGCTGLGLIAAAIQIAARELLDE